MFFDWTDACVAHPFLDPLNFFQEDEEEVDGALHHAVSYRSLAANLEPPIDAHMTRSTTHWLRKVLAGLRQLTGR